MNKDLEKAIQLLKEHPEYTCVFVKGEEVFTSDLKGVARLIAFLDEKKDVSGFAVADRIVGKAAALLYIDLKVKEVYGEVMSVRGKEVLEKYHIPYTFQTLVEGIRNRTNTGSCPMEMAVQDIEDPLLAPVTLKEAMARMRKGK